MHTTIDYNSIISQIIAKTTQPKLAVNLDIKGFEKWLKDNQLRYIDMLAWYEEQALDFIFDKNRSYPNSAFCDGYKNYDERAEFLWNTETLSYDYRRWYEAGAFASHLEKELANVIK